MESWRHQVQSTVIQVSLATVVCGESTKIVHAGQDLGAHVVSWVERQLCLPSIPACILEDVVSSLEGLSSLQGRKPHTLLKRRRAAAQLPAGFCEVAHLTPIGPHEGASQVPHRATEFGKSG